MTPRWLVPAPPAPPLEGLRRGHYRVFLVDPPWAFEAYSGERMTPHRTALDHYGVMGLDELARMPVVEYAAADAAVIMWVVGSHLKQAIELGEAWGFTFKTDLLWWLKEKLRHADQINLFTGDVEPPKMSFGYWSRKEGEMCLLFTRGSPKRRSKGVRQVIAEPAREHSRKPDEARRRIEQLLEGPYVELFARERAPGWDAWGNEVGKFGKAA